MARAGDLQQQGMTMMGDAEGHSLPSQVCDLNLLALLATDAFDRLGTRPLDSQ